MRMASMLPFHGLLLALSLEALHHTRVEELILRDPRCLLLALEYNLNQAFPLKIASGKSEDATGEGTDLHNFEGDDTKGRLDPTWTRG